MRSRGGLRDLSRAVALVALGALGPLPAASPAAAEEPSAPGPPAGLPPAPPVAVGRVVRSLDGRPFPGARVRISVPGHPPVEAVSGEDGWFEAGGLPRGVPAGTSVEGEGLAAARYPGLRIPEGGVLALDPVEVGAGQELRFRVVDGRGAPQAEARVAFHPIVPGLEEAARGPEWPSPVPASTASTDGSGLAVLGGVPPGLGFLEVRKDGLASHRRWEWVREGERRAVETVVLRAGASVQGRLLDPVGGPIPGLTLGIREGEDPCARWTTVTDSRGGYRFDGLGARRYTIFARPSADRSIDLETFEAPGARILDLVLDRRAGLDARVLDAESGKPLPGTAVEIRWHEDFHLPGAGWARAVAGKDGVASFRELPPMTVRTVRAVGGGWFADYRDWTLHSEFNLQAHRVVSRDLRLSKAPVVEGRAVDTEGRPVPRVRVWALVQSSGHEETPPAWTDAQGNYRLEVPAGGPGILRLHPPAGFHPEDYPRDYHSYTYRDRPASPYALDVRPGMRTRCDLRFRTGGTVEGVVVTPEGIPVQGIPVSVHERGNGGGGGGVGPPSGPDGSFRLEHVLPSVKDGLFAWGPGPGGMQAYSGYFTLWEGPKAVARGVLLRTEEGCAIEGKVVSRGGATLDRVELRCMEGAHGESPDLGYFLAVRGRPVAVGPGGDFRVEGLRKGDWTFRCLQDGEAIGRAVVVTVAAGETARRVEVPFEPLPSVEGRIVDDSGRPIPGVRLYVRPQERRETVRRSRNSEAFATTDEEGRFALRAMPGESFEATLDAPGFEIREERLRAGRGPKEFILGRGEGISGTVVDAGTGRAIPGILVEAWSWGEGPHRGVPRMSSRDGHFRQFAITDEKGAFEFAGLEKGDFRLRFEDRPIEADDGACGDFTEVVLDPVAAGTRGLKVRMEAGRRIAGRVRDASGAPLQGLLVQVSGPTPYDPLDENSHRYRSTWTDGTGAFLVSGLPPGKYEVRVSEVSAGGETYSPQEIDGVPAGKPDVKLTLKRK